jgi:hypothetical protein
MAQIQVPRRWVEYFRRCVQGMSPRSGVYKMLKDELSKQGHWKNLPRGKPFRKF